MLLSSSFLRSAARAVLAWQALALIQGLPSPASAMEQAAGQTVRVSPSDSPVAFDTSRVRSVISQLEPDSRLRLETASSEARLEGRFVRSDSGSVVFRAGVDEVVAPLGDIERLWTRGRAVGQGAWFGAIGGLVIGVVYGVAISEVTCAESSCTTLGLAAATGGVGAVGGAALGALIGLAIPRWKLRFP